MEKKNRTRKFKVFLLMIPILLLPITTYAYVNLDKFPKAEGYDENIGSSLRNYVETKQYSNNDFSISIPNDYVQVAENCFSNPYGNSINIAITPFSGKIQYDEKNLDEIEKVILEEISSNQKDNLKSTLQEIDQDIYSDDELDEIVNSFKLNSIIKKEITSISQNNYTAFHFIISYTILDTKLYFECYEIFSKSNVYTLGITTLTREDLKSLEIRTAINSLILHNYELPDTTTSSSIFDNAIEASLSVAIIVIFSNIVRYFNKNKQEKEQKKYEDNEVFKEYNLKH